MNIRVFLCINVEQTWTLKWNRIAGIANAQTQKQGSRAQEVTLHGLLGEKPKQPKPVVSAGQFSNWTEGGMYLEYVLWGGA